MKKSSAVALLIFAFCLTPYGVSTAQDTKPADSTTAPANNIVVVRVYAQPTIWPSTVQADGNVIASLNQKTFTAFHLEPGHHVLRIKWPLLSTQRSVDFHINVEQGQPYYLSITGSITPEGGRYFRVESGVDQLDPATAPKLIEACCKLIPPRS